MATIERRQRSDGTTAYRVRFREKPGTNPTTETFDTADQAAYFADLVDRIGGEAARAKRNVASGRQGPTLIEALADYRASAPDLGPGTGDEYARMLTRSGIEARMGTLPLALIDRTDVEKWVAVRASEVSPKTVKNEHGLLSALFSHAMMRGWCDRNPAKGVRLPKRVRPELEILTADQFLAIHAEVADRFKSLVWLLAATGMRWGEATALQWRDISGTQITVQRAWKRNSGSGRVLGPPKTAKGFRRVETTEAVIASLGPHGEPSDFVFTNAQGRPVLHSTFWQSHWVPACERAGVTPAPKIHSLRHFAASFMLASGADIFEVSRALGHSDISVTTGTYGHLVPSRTRPTVVHAAALDAQRLAQLES